MYFFLDNSAFLSYNIKSARRCDGIGRRSGLKIRWGNPYRFKPGHRHQRHSELNCRNAFLLFIRPTVHFIRLRMQLE